MPMLSRLLPALPVLAALVAPGCDDHAAAPAAAQHGTLLFDEGGFEFVEPQHAAHPNWIDLGDIELGEVRTGRVRLKNVERVAITVTGVHAGCSCTLPSLSYIDASGARVEGDMGSETEVLRVPPGAVAELELRVDSRLAPVKNKDKLVIVNIVTDSEVEPYLQIEARMRILAPFQCVPSDINLGRIGVNSGGQGFAQLGAVGDSGARLVDVGHAPSDVQASLVLGEVAGRELWTLTARVEPPLPLGYQERTLELATTGAGATGAGRPFVVKLRWTGTPDVEVVPNRLLFLRSGAGAGERAEVEVLAHMPGQRFKVLRSTLSGPGAERVRVIVTPLAPDAAGRSDRIAIALEPVAELGTAALEGLVVLELDDPQFPRLEVPFFRRGL